VSQGAGTSSANQPAARRPLLGVVDALTAVNAVSLTKRRSPTTGEQQPLGRQPPQAIAFDASRGRQALGSMEGCAAGRQPLRAQAAGQARARRPARQRRGGGRPSAPERQPARLGACKRGSQPAGQEGGAGRPAAQRWRRHAGSQAGADGGVQGSGAPGTGTPCPRCAEPVTAFAAAHRRRPHDRCRQALLPPTPRPAHVRVRTARENTPPPAAPQAVLPPPCPKEHPPPPPPLH